MYCSGEQLDAWTSTFTLEELLEAGETAKARAIKRKTDLSSHYIQQANKRRKKTIRENPEEEDLVAEVLAHRAENGEYEYHVRWEGYDDEAEFTWQSRESLTCDGEVIDALGDYFELAGDPETNDNEAVN